MESTTPRSHHADRIHRVIRHIQDHLDDPFAPADLASVACYSVHHFHRVFRGMVGESVMDHVRRLRLERAALQLKSSKRPVTALALDAGFESHEAFTRAFKRTFGVPPSRYRRSPRPLSFPRSPSGVHFAPEGGPIPFQPLPPTPTDGELHIRRFPARRIVFVRHVGRYDEVGNAWDRLMTLAAAAGLIGPEAEMLGLCHDDPEVTPAEQCRYDACLLVACPVDEAAGLQVGMIPEGEYAALRHLGPYDEVSVTYAALFGRLIPAAGREAAPAPSVERYWNDPETTPAEELDTDVFVLLAKEVHHG